VKIPLGGPAVLDSEQGPAMPGTNQAIADDVITARTLRKFCRSEASGQLTGDGSNTAKTASRGPGASGVQQLGADANADADGHKDEQKCHAWHQPARQWGVSGSDGAQHPAVALRYEDQDAEAGNRNE